VAVKIYKNKGNVRGEDFPTFLLSYYASGKRQLRRFMDFAKASNAATLTAGRSGGRIELKHFPMHNFRNRQENRAVANL
jgi:hypothetical protein